MITKTVRRQIRGFVLIWLSITFVMVMSTFLAIYFTYDQSPGETDFSNPLPLETPVEASPAPADSSPSASPEPSPTPMPQPEPTAPAPYEMLDIPSPASSPIPGEESRYQVGIQVEHSPDFNPDNQDGWYRSVSEDLGLQWVKHQVRWEQMEAEPGEIDWSVLDFIMPSAEKFGVKMLLSVITAPDWAREEGVNLDRRGPPADPQTYATFLTEVVTRYPGRVHAIEVWNKQNVDQEWTSVDGLNAADYVSLLRTAYQAVKAIDPSIIVISGALSPTGIHDGIGAYNDFFFMDELIEAGLLDWADCVGARHLGYNISPSFRYNEIPDDPMAVFRGPFDNPHHSWSFRSTLEGYANRIRAAGRDSKLCVTEFGWPSAEDLADFSEDISFALDNTLTEQARWTVQAMSFMEEWGFVWLAFIWNFNYGPQAGWAVDNDNVPYSLIGPGFRFRPAYDAIRHWQQDYLTRTG